MAADGDSAADERVALSSRVLVMPQVQEVQDGGVGYFGRMRRCDGKHPKTRAELVMISSGYSSE